MKKLILVIMSLVVVVLLGAAALGTFASSSPKEIKTIGESELTDNNNVDKPKFHPTRKVASATSFKDKMIFRLKGCKIMHEFDQATVIDCPPGLEIKNSRPEKMYYLTDMDSNIQISANKVWNLIDEDGENVTGKNVAVAVLDTGIDTSHEEFSQTLIINQKDFVNFDDTANDDHGHGTHVAGNIAAYGYRADAKGVAPGVDLMIGKVCSSSGCPEGAIVEGIQWAIDNDAQVISMSLGGGNYGGHCDDIGDLTVEAVNEAYAANIVVAVASGNDASGVSSPACASGAVAVGAVNTRDKIARFSNTGTALDVVAPGVEILSSYPCYLVPITTSIYYGCGDDPCASCVW
ncbi:MAG: S8 family serine peptidase, partial [Nanoarchaeota archaeon]|nr:S8 family serine peptidase [Nanoarchaeota archaeon]